MGELLDGIRLYGRLVAARVRAQLQYRTSFALDLAGNFFISFLDFAAILVIFSNVPQLGGWSVAEVALLYGMSNLAFALTDFAVGELDQFPQQIRDGTFDQVLIRPRGTLFQVVTGNFQLRRLGKALQALLILGYALTALPVEWTVDRLLVFALAVPAGTVIFCSVWVVAICIVFWAVDGREAANAFTYGGQFFTQFPINIYDRWLRRFLAYAVPLAFVAYFPALYVLDKPDPLGLPGFVPFLAPVAALAFAMAAAALWRLGVRHYRSTGS